MEIELIGVFGIHSAHQGYAVLAAESPAGEEMQCYITVFGNGSPCANHFYRVAAIFGIGFLVDGWHCLFGEDAVDPEYAGLHIALIGFLGIKQLELGQCAHFLAFVEFSGHIGEVSHCVFIYLEIAIALAVGLDGYKSRHHIHAFGVIVVARYENG